MPHQKPVRLSVTPSLAHPNTSKTTSSVDPFSDQPQKPDWLVLFMSVLLLLTLLIIWLVDIPALLD